jgi:hypothetical protein
MLVIDGQICYSPKPPLAYGGKKGFASCCTTIQEWNIAWLSFPQLDCYLDNSWGKVEFEGPELTNKDFGGVRALASELTENTKLGLLKQLRLHPREFLNATLEFPWEHHPTYKDFDAIHPGHGEYWVTTIRRRAMSIANEKVDGWPPSAKPAVTGNVIPVNFRRKRP